MIPWDELAAALEDVYPKRARQDGGRPHRPVVLMIKCLLLQKWFNLSDPQLDEMPRDRISFRRFASLPFEDAPPDETTPVVFRRRLRR
ncbi:MAG TPA: transposase [Phycisphaerae bacterium]|nr:transposase [Phycisphaerae bacterium]HNU46969.1 transposase [Phycisphaerae bacterium]